MPELPVTTNSHDPKAINTVNVARRRRTRAFIMAEQWKKSKNPKYNGRCSNAITMMLASQPGRTADGPGASSKMWDLLSAGLGLARDKQSYQNLVRDLIAQHPDPISEEMFVKDCAAAMTYDNCEFMEKKMHNMWVRSCRSCRPLLHSSSSRRGAPNDGVAVLTVLWAAGACCPNSGGVARHEEGEGCQHTIMKGLDLASPALIKAAVPEIEYLSTVRGAGIAKLKKGADFLATEEDYVGGWESLLDRYVAVAAAGGDYSKMPYHMPCPPGKYSEGPLFDPAQYRTMLNIGTFNLSSLSSVVQLMREAKETW